MSIASTDTLTVVAHEVRMTGGMERAQFEVISGLLARGWHVHLIARVCELPEHPRLRWTRIPTPRRPFAVAYPTFAIVASCILARRRRGMVTALGAIVLNRVDVMTVQFCHHGYAERELPRAQKPSLARRLNDHVGARLSLAMERWCIRPRNVAQIVAVSRLVADELHKHFPSIGAIAVIPNGVDLERFRPDAARRREMRARIGVSDEAEVSLFVGGDWQRKGLAVAIEAAGRAAWTLLVVGEGDPEQYQSVIESSRADVRFLGMTDDPAAIFSCADAFLLPSAYEGFALVTIEAAASGLPLLVTSATGASELAEAGGGFVLERDAVAFAGALSALSSDRRLRERMSRAARTAATRLGWPQIVESNEEVLRSYGARRRDAPS